MKILFVILTMSSFAHAQQMNQYEQDLQRRFATPIVSTGWQQQATTEPVIYPQTPQPTQPKQRVVTIPQVKVQSESAVRETAKQDLADMNLFDRDLAPSNCVAEIESKFRQGLSQGIACLRRLNTAQTQIHLDKIQKLMRGQDRRPIKVLCQPGLKTKDGAPAAGQGSPPSNPQFPTIWISTDYEVSPATFFHETFHLLDDKYDHEHGPDYTTACEKCCFEKSQRQCQVCAGN